MTLKETFLTKSVAKKIESFFAVDDDDKGIVLLFGWISDKIGHCIGCSRLIDDFEEISSLFPAGLSVLGIYVKSADNQNASTITKAKEFYEKFAKPEIQEITDRGYMILLSNSSIHTYKCECYIYECLEGTLTNIPLKVPMMDSYHYPSTIITARITGKLPISFEVAKTKVETLANIDKAFANAREKLFAHTCMFYFEQTSVIISPGKNIDLTNKMLKSGSTCKDIARCFFDEAEEDETELMDKDKAKKKKKHAKSTKEMMNVKLLFQATGNDAENEAVSTAPVIFYEKCQFKCASFYVKLDVTAAIPVNILLSDLPSIFANKVAAQLSVIGKLVKQHLSVHGTPYTASAHHFKTPYTDHIITVVYPDGIHDEKLEHIREKIHTQLLLPKDRPLIRKPMKLALSCDTSSSSYLQNVHIGLHQSGVSGGELATVQGNYTYHHYMQGQYDDKGWGCAYRSLQTLVSWFIQQGYTSRGVPSHEEIQKALVAIGDKPASFVGSKKWIGSSEVGYCLDHFLGLQCKIISVSSGEELSEKGAELIYHFRNQGTPVMIGGGVLAHTILGVHYNNTGEIKFLVLDPHYTGTDDLKIIQGKGWCGWKGPNFWDRNAFYNLCLPLRPTGI